MKPKYVVLSVLLSMLTFFAIAQNLEPKQRTVAAISALIGGLWFTEGLPLAATSFLIPVLLTFFGITNANQALAPFFSSTIALILGGFVMAKAVSKNNIDMYIAGKLLEKFPNTKSGLLFALCIVTMFLSFFTQNTVTTLMMLPIGLSLVQKDDNMFAKAVVLAIAYSASVGGIGTIIGTAPNAVAVGVLAEKGTVISFLEWMIYCAPLAIILTMVLLKMLQFRFKFKDEKVQVNLAKAELGKKWKMVLGFFVLVITLWILEQIPAPLDKILGWKGHGISSGVVGMFACALFMVLDLVEDGDIDSLPWSTLILLGGGILLGNSFSIVGLDKTIAGTISTITGNSATITLSLLVITSALLTILASNTATAAVMAPISIAVAQASGLNVKLALIAGCSATSLDFILPTGTPPNAIAYATKKVKLQEMISVGASIMVVAVIIAIIYFLGLNALLSAV